MSLISWSIGQLVQASATVFLNFEAGLEPGGEHLGPLAVELLVVWNQLPALFEPLVQGRVVLVEIRQQLTLDQGGEAGQEDDVGQRQGVRFGDEPETGVLQIIPRRLGLGRGHSSRVV